MPSLRRGGRRDVGDTRAEPRTPSDTAPLKAAGLGSLGQRPAAPLWRDELASQRHARLLTREGASPLPKKGRFVESRTKQHTGIRRSATPHTWPGPHRRNRATTSAETNAAHARPRHLSKATKTLPKTALSEIDCTTLGETDGIAPFDGNTLYSNTCDGWKMVFRIMDGRTSEGT